MSGQPFRHGNGGRIDRSRPIGFTFDGARLQGYAGDTLASALIANGVHLVGRSFKYHRPRGILSAGAEEPNALVQLGVGPATEPNRPATQVQLYPGLAAASQNRWPSVHTDLGVVNDLLAPLLPAGFYYKTFMAPAGAWQLYERFIRKAAGFGRTPVGRDPDRYDHLHAHCDVLVVGAGAAGLAAALAAGRSGARVILADEQAEPGGALLAEAPDGAAIDGRPAADWLASTLAELGRLPAVRLLPRTTVFGYYDHNFLGLLERVTDHLSPGAADADAPRQRLWKLRAKRVVLASGAIERALVFPDNDRPGIMLAGAARTYVNRYAVRPGGRAVILTNNDSAYRAALDLDAVGIEVAALVDLRPRPEGELPRLVRDAGIEILAGNTIVATTGRGRVDSVRVMRLDPAGRTVEAGKETIVACDLVCMSGGWTPAVHLFSQSRGRLRFDPSSAAFVPGSSFQAERSAGAAAGATSLAQCLAEGLQAGAEAARAAGFAAEEVEPPTVREPAEAPARALWLLPSSRRASRVKAFVDFQNDVTAKDLALAVREGYRSVEHVKRYTTTGMGTDQGKIGNLNALGIVAEELHVTIPEVGVTTFRPPYTPVTFGAIAGRSVGRLYAPVRKTPIDPWHVEHGARFEAVGALWQRASYYPQGGETTADAVAREVKAVRQAVGVFDASTLGKIDVHGRDAAAFLDRVYTNSFATLPVGACRYGLMLGEDGMVKDDGVTTRLAEDHFHVTTTTGGAGAVMDWLEELLQTEWRDLRVHLTAVTEQWAVIVLAGPSARRCLADLGTDIDLDTAAFPHLTMREGQVAGIPARLFRVSFSGELSYEINVPAAHGLALWQAAMAAGARHGATPYGTEAIHVLRAEKGYIIVGQETDGTTTPFDLGMDWIVARRKPDFIGKRALDRSDLRRDDRKQLVGLLTEDPAVVLEEGAHLIETETVPPPPVPMLGHVTSSYASPSLGRSIALALVRGGRQRLGQTLYVAMPDRTIRVTVTKPVFYDAEGARLHA